MVTDSKAQNRNWPIQTSDWRITSVKFSRKLPDPKVFISYHMEQNIQIAYPNKQAYDLKAEFDSSISISRKEKKTLLKATGNIISNYIDYFELINNANSERFRYGPILQKYSSFQNATSNLFSMDEEVSYSIKELRKSYRYYYFAWRNNPRLLLRFTGGVHLAHRQFLVDDPGFSQSDALTIRSINEDPTLNSMQEISVGIKISGSNYITLPLVNLNMGFKSVKSGMDWHSGLPTAGPGKTYRFNFKGIGIGYSYNNFRKTSSPRVDAQLIYMNLKKYKESGTELSTDVFQDRYLMGSFGIGGNFRITKDLSMGIVPTLYYIFTPIQQGLLQTRLYNFGLNLSFTGGFWF